MTNSARTYLINRWFCSFVCTGVQIHTFQYSTGTVPLIYFHPQYNFSRPGTDQAKHSRPRIVQCQSAFNYCSSPPSQCVTKLRVLPAASPLGLDAADTSIRLWAMFQSRIAATAKNGVKKSAPAEWPRALKLLHSGAQCNDVICCTVQYEQQRIPESTAARRVWYCRYIVVY